MFSHAKHVFTHTHTHRRDKKLTQTCRKSPRPSKIIHIWNTSESKKLRMVKTTDTDYVHSDKNKIQEGHWRTKKRKNQLNKIDNKKGEIFGLF